jgi:cell wall-associated NlpC family hydrolase
MPDYRALVARRVPRRPSRTSSRPAILVWLRLLSVSSRHAPLHLLALAIGAAAVVVTSVGSRPTVAPVRQDVDELSAVEVEPDDEQAAPVVEPVAQPALVSYAVEDGDTLLSIGERFGVSVATIAAANDLHDPDALEIGQELVIPPTSGVLHALDSGETLAEIGRRYDVDPQVIANANQMQLIADVPVRGQKLVVPNVEPVMPVALPKARAASPLSYVVQEGDSLGSLAVQFGVSLRTILMANNIADADSVTAGTELRVLPVSGIEHVVDKGESLADIAASYRVDLGPIVDFNGLNDPDTLAIGARLIIPGATGRVIQAKAPEPEASQSASSSAPVLASAGSAAPVRQASLVAPLPTLGAGGAGIVKNAMAYLGSAYVFGGTSPGGFDCSGFVWYVHKISGIGISRGIWGQLNGGPRITMANLVPGDTVFFANTYMPGLSHVGIYIGGGRFVHAVDESRGVGISGLGEAYWSSRYIGAARLF